jgi:excisionase family DNA binding protein
MSLLVDIPGAAVELGGISSTTVRRLIAAGELPTIRLGRRVLIEEAALVDWVQRTKQRRAHRESDGVDVEGANVNGLSVGA